MINFIRSGLFQWNAHGIGIIEVGGIKIQTLLVNPPVTDQMFQVGNIEAIHAINQSVDFVILFEEQFREIGTVLPLNAGDEGAFHLSCLPNVTPGSSRWAFQ